MIFKKSKLCRSSLMTFTDVSILVSQSAQAAVTKHYTLGSLTNELSFLIWEVQDQGAGCLAISSHGRGYKLILSKGLHPHELI